MKLWIAILALVSLVPVPAAAENAPTAGAEDAAVRAAIDHYFRGHATGDGAHFRKVFHPSSKLYWIRDGQIAERTSEDYIAGSPGKPAADENVRKRTVEWIDVTGDTAVAKLRLDYPGVVLTDYMALLKVNGEWKIVNKIFNRAPKPAPAP